MPSVKKDGRKERRRIKNRSIKEAKVERALAQLQTSETNDDNSLVNRAAKLTHVNKGIRDKAFEQFREWILCNECVNKLQMLKLWKGFYYCFWMSDIARIQQDLAERLCALVSKMTVSKALLYVDSFWFIMHQEWSKLDRYRLDKYYFLMRQMYRATFSLAERVVDNVSNAQKLTDIIANGPLSRKNPQLNVGIQYHASEAQYDEFISVVDWASDKGRAEKVLALAIGPFLETFVMTDNFSLAEKLFTSLVTPFSKLFDFVKTNLGESMASEAKVPSRGKKERMIKSLTL